MVSWFNAATVFCDGYSLVSSPIPQIIQNGTYRISSRKFLAALTIICRVLLACIRFLARCPCPRCYVQKDEIRALGTVQDKRRRDNIRRDNIFIQEDIEKARRLIYLEGLSVNSQRVEGLLKGMSLQPVQVSNNHTFSIVYQGLSLTYRTQSAFSILMWQFGFNFYTLFKCDLMHEFELGVWKMVLIHILRILYALPADKIQVFNERYAWALLLGTNTLCHILFCRFRQAPTFGKETIRRFGNNVSGLKKLAARDYEDILQVCVFKLNPSLCLITLVTVHPPLPRRTGSW